MVKVETTNPITWECGCVSALQPGCIIPRVETTTDDSPKYRYLSALFGWSKSKRRIQRHRSADVVRHMLHTYSQNNDSRLTKCRCVSPFLDGENRNDGSRNTEVPTRFGTCCILRVETTSHDSRNADTFRPFLDGESRNDGSRCTEVPTRTCFDPSPKSTKLEQ